MADLRMDRLGGNSLRGPLCAGEAFALGPRGPDRAHPERGGSEGSRESTRQHTAERASERVRKIELRTPTRTCHTRARR